ncbi:copper resistance D family protein [Robertmurraya sp. FSL R5-0851]|uniref:copper resistance D family protein n=1 Tax=Robertmurraya sp. FSL R5-0851 TaxID=2921584 RepID=UPI0030F9B256
MLVLMIISKTLLYLCFSLTFGTFLLTLIPNTHKPKVNVSKHILMIAIIGIPLSTFFPILQTILFLTPRIGFGESFQSVLTTFEVGKSWVFIFSVSFILIIFISSIDYQRKKLYGYIGAILTFILIVGVSWSSHASSISQFFGGLSHTLHFTAVSVWVGILIVISWFSTNYDHWLKFLNWFTPIALCCFVSTIISGLILMTLVITDYTNSWLFPYGQALLIKHILIIPLLIYAIINGIFVKRKIKRDPNFNPKTWTRIECIIILLIFTVTAVLGQQAPPNKTTLLNPTSFDTRNQ